MTTRAGGAVLAALLLCAAAAPAAAADGSGVIGPEVPESVPEPNLAASITELSGAVSDLDLGVVEELSREEDEGGTTVLTISSDVLFAFDEAELTDAALRELDELAERLAGGTGTVAVVGHTDGLGDDSYNQELSERRAEAVGEALAERLGSGGPDISASGRGAEQPVAAETTAEGTDDPGGRAANRRVEISFEG
ncbi:OmpA family protein [Allonocardiopsis opalescens]|uniref:Outer membrane protein OmpA-like peptidoglycan-associated protein n=1 Tax=Allonocardiopsis opalescens TaxID=1144618 RepID=A0A2T0Q4G8_9ACTN|nr:OmpA family protein [Allonocardiopsis opalescens]PRX98692.1 outer membrane protein OmpA-like peptidoglycan-associated protein [Allonocardiopsis opalescens]